MWVAVVPSPATASPAMPVTEGDGRGPGTPRCADAACGSEECRVRCAMQAAHPHRPRRPSHCQNPSRRPLLGVAGGGAGVAAGHEVARPVKERRRRCIQPILRGFPTRRHAPKAASVRRTIVGVVHPCFRLQRVPTLGQRVVLTDRIPPPPDTQYNTTHLRGQGR